MNQLLDSKRNYEWLKRVFDLVFASFLIIVLSPFFLLICFLVWVEVGTPVFFRQLRPGKDERPFTIIKFRTMTNARNKDGFLLAETERLRPLGRFLRKFSLDELPELLNVLMGQMSFVGPRPLLMQYLGYYTPLQARRHAVKPGITGWAQIHGRNNTPFSKRFEMDVWYVDNRSFPLDLKILILTIIKVFKREGVRDDLGYCYKQVNDCGLPNDIIE